MDAEDAPRCVLAVDGDAHPAVDVVVEEEGRAAEPRLFGEVPDNDGRAGGERVTGLACEARAHLSLVRLDAAHPADSCAEGECLAVRVELEDLGELDVEHAR